MPRPCVLIAAAVLSCAAKAPKFDPSVALALQPGTSIQEAIARLGKPKTRIVGPNGGQLLGWMRTHGGLLFSDPKTDATFLLFDKDGRLVRSAAKAGE